MNNKTVQVYDIIDAKAGSNEFVQGLTGPVILASFLPIMLQC